MHERPESQDRPQRDEPEADVHHEELTGGRDALDDESSRTGELGRDEPAD